jgi:hypothetical protein
MASLITGAEKLPWLTELRREEAVDEERRRDATREWGSGEGEGEARGRGNCRSAPELLRLITCHESARERLRSW